MKTYPTILPVVGSASCRIVEMTAEQRGQTEAYCDTYALARAELLRRFYRINTPRRMPQSSVLEIMRRIVNGAIEMGWISDEEARILLYGTSLPPDGVIRGHSVTAVVLDELRADGDRIRYVCPECGHGGAHPKILPAPFCDRCDFKITMRPKS